MIIERVKALGLPTGQFVVIGSGVLDALGLREAHDIDLVVTPAYFEVLKADGWVVTQIRGEEVLTHGDAEVWLSWGSPDARPNFDDLYADGVTISGIRFASPAFVRDWKIAASRPKDAADIALLDRYLACG